MQTITRNTRRTSRALKQLMKIATAGAFAVVPFVGGALPIEAAPPTWSNNDRNRESRTIEGVVANDLQGRDFVLRLNNGQRLQVRSDDREPMRLSEGDRVRVAGFFRRNQPNLFHAESVQILDNQNDNNTRTFTGRVSNVVSDQRFDLRVGSTTYNVISTSRLPRRLNEGDQVRVYGRRTGSNDISNATVVVINNRDNDDNDNQFRNFTGRVTKVESDQRFDIAINGITFNVIATSRLPRRLTRGDYVRVYGTRTGDNDISRATVTTIDNDDGNRINNNNTTRTFTGRVTRVVSDQRFDISVGGVDYDVTLSSRLPRRLTRGDYVRVYGVPQGDNNIANASVSIIDNR
jgi:membrane protein implicated in regulation of membrane protease activity/translation initiation factor IF-1